MKKLVSLFSDNEYITVSMKKRPFHIIKNILLLLFLIGSVYAPWYTNAMWCFGAGREPALGTFTNTLYFFGSVLLYAFLADKWWNLPCGIYMLLINIGSVAGIIAPDSSLYDGFNLLVLSPTWGLYFPAHYSNVWATISSVITLVFGTAVLGILLHKYLRKEIRNEKFNS